MRQLGRLHKAGSTRPAGSSREEPAYQEGESVRRHIYSGVHHLYVNAAVHDPTAAKIDEGGHGG